MKKNVKKLVMIACGALIISTLLSGMLVSVNADDIINEGKCGKNVTWRFNDETDTLTIQGSGKVEYDSNWDELDIVKVDMKEGITGIDDYAFSGLNTINMIIIPKSVNDIGDCAFQQTGIKKMTIKKSVKKVGNQIFWGCKKLKEIDWHINRIPQGTFANCTRLKVVKISSKTKSIGALAFYNTAISQFDMPDTVKWVGESAFASCKKLETLVFSNNVKKIPSNVVKNCNLKSVTMGDNTTTIDKSAFAKSNIQELVIPNSVKKIKEKAFYKTAGIKKITIPENINKINNYTFYKCPDLEEIEFNNKLKIIGENAFAKCKKLQKIVIPKSVKTIEYKAFEKSGCTEVVLSEGVQDIEYWAFNDCNRLSKIVVSSTVVNICYNSFVACDNLIEIEVDTNNSTYTSFEGCLMNKECNELLLVPGGKSGVFEIPASVTKIDAQAFYGCNKITAFAATNNKSFACANGILYNNTMTKLISSPISKTGTITIPETVTEIGESAFQNSEASQIILPETVTTIGYCAFEQCNNIRKITIPGSVTKVAHAAFWECDNLERVEIEYGTKKIQRNAFHGCNKLNKIVIPASVYFIAESAFTDSYDVNIYCKKSSYAMAYATKWYINYKVI